MYDAVRQYEDWIRFEVSARESVHDVVEISLGGFLVSLLVFTSFRKRGKENSGVFTALASSLLEDLRGL
jgi:hypothetical protein